MRGAQGGVNDRARSHLSIWCLAKYSLFVEAVSLRPTTLTSALLIQAIVIVYAFGSSLLGILESGCGSVRAPQRLALSVIRGCLLFFRRKTRECV